MSDNLLDVIRYVGDNKTVVYKHEIKDFNTKSQIIVGESQEAIFYKDGQALDLFGPGRHPLNSDNLPILKRIFGAIFGGRNPFQCEVYFINKVTLMDLGWGTNAPIPLEDPKYGVPVGVRAFGEMGARVADSRKFLVKVVGQLDSYDDDAIKKATKSMVMLSVKDTIAKAIINNGWSILEISAKLSELSDSIKGLLNARLDDYGLILDNFFINSISAGDEDMARLIKVRDKRFEAMTDIDIDAERVVRMGKARAEARQAEGFTYQEERRFDVMQQAAQNEGIAGTMMGAGMGVGMGFGVGGEIGRMTQQAMQQQPMQQPAPQGGAVCANCKAPLANDAKFCASCGNPVAPKKSFCISCGTELAPGARFCSGCGAEQVQAEKACPECGTKLSPSARFCHSCGHRFE